MELSRDQVLSNIHGCTAKIIEFVDEWFDSKPYVTAHTSGSTGAPKNIQLLKSDMIASAASTNRFFNLTERATLLCPLSIDYIAGKMMVVRAIVSGARLWMEKPGNTPVNTCDEHINLIAVVPSQVPHLIENRNILEQIDNILIGGAQLPEELAERVVAAGGNAYVSYGMTETCSHVALRKVDGSTPEIYEAMPDISFSTDERGCLIIRSDARSFKELHTNDIVSLVDGAHFEWKGRYDNVINSGGIKVYPEEIERQISSAIPGQVEFYIGKCHDPKWGEVPGLVISEKFADEDCILAKVREMVKSKAERPARIIISKIAHTSSGKIIRQKFE